MRFNIFTGGPLGAAGLGAMMLTTALSSGTVAHAADCPAVTVDDAMGVAAGAFPQQYELAEFEGAAGCALSFQENPAMGDLNARIGGNPDLPALADRLPAEPLVIAPYNAIGVYGGVLNGLSNATEAGTSDLLSTRHVNLVRYADDLQTIVPNIAKSWSWNDDFTVLTVTLRDGHKWSDGHPFTAEDVVFWYENLILDTNIYAETPERWLFNGEPMQVEAVDATTVTMTFPVPSPGILNRFAVDYGQPFQPKHFLGQFHIAINPDADALATERGFDNWADLLNNYYGGSDWKDVPSPLLKGTDTVVVPTLESHILVGESSTGRQMVANPYFHMVDTAGNQLPYIPEIDELYVPDKEVRNLKITNGEVDYKQQAIFIDDFPLYKENESRGNYSVQLGPGLGDNVYYGFNVTHKDEGMRAIFADIRFRQAMSLAIDRDEINELVFLGQGSIQQATPAEPATVAFINEDHLNAFVDYDPEGAMELLDAMDLIDRNGDDQRDMADGSPFVVQLQYSNQGSPVRMHELVAGYWGDIGVRVDLKEVTSDEYRAQGNNNDLDVTVWKNDNISAPTVSQNISRFIPAFGDYFNPGNGFEWATWKRSEGAQGIEPPEDVKKLWDLADEFLKQPLGTDASNAIGGEIVDIHVDNLWKIGTVGNIVSPVIHHNTLANFPTITATTYDYYRAYPFRAFQWYFSE